MHWTPENIKIAKDILGRTSVLDEATVFKISAKVGGAVTKEGLRRAFGRAGEASPTECLGRNLLEYEEIYDLTYPTVGQVLDNIEKRASKASSKIVNAVNRVAEKSTTRIVVVSDLHAPFQDMSAWNCVLQVIRETSPETVVIIGDFADCMSISSHPKSLDRKHDFASEVAGVNAALDELRGAAGDACRLVWTCGNHEDRITRYLQSSAPELGGIKELRAEGLFQVKERGIEWIPYRRSIKIGNCSFTHDVGRCGVNTARQSLMDWGGNLVVGHSHRGGIAFQGESKGSSHFCLNVGWLGDVDGIDYQHRMRVLRDHQCGFGIVDQSPSGFSWPQFIPVLNGECVVDGKVIIGQKAAA